MIKASDQFRVKIIFKVFLLCMKTYLQISTKYFICHQKVLREILFFLLNLHISISICSLGRYKLVKAWYSQIYVTLEQILRNYK